MTFARQMVFGVPVNDMRLKLGRGCAEIVRGIERIGEILLNPDAIGISEILYLSLIDPDTMVGFDKILGQFVFHDIPFCFSSRRIT